MSDSSARSREERRVSVVVALGDGLPRTVAEAVAALGGLWRLLPPMPAEVAVVTAEPAADAPAAAAGQLLVEELWREGRTARLVFPLQGPRRVLRAVTGQGDWHAVDVSASGARFAEVPISRSLLGPALVGVGRIGSPSDPYPLAIGLWPHYVHPRLAIPARLSGDRAPLLADLATPFRPSLLVLVGQLLGYVVTAATTDLIAAELVGVALRFAAVEPELRPRPWEDPLAQRATELDLGVRLPSQIDLSIVTAGVPRDEAIERLTAQVREMLGLAGEARPG